MSIDQQQSDAVISRCERYRYLLRRHGDVAHPERGTALFVMLNPSKADATEDDPTIRRCRGFARDWGCSGLVVANLYALRATSPSDLWKADDPVGPENDAYLRSLAREYREAVFAWGANAPAERVAEVKAIFEDAGARMWCLGVTKSGAPRHPLYIPKDRELVPWPATDTQ